MNSKKVWAIWSIFLILLTGCEEIHGVISFEKNGSGILSLKIVYPESSKIDVETCRKSLTSIEWTNVSHERIRSMNNPSGSDQCAYTYSFNDLDEVEKLYRGLGLKLNRLTINTDEFTYKATDNTCVKDFDPNLTKSVTWSVKPPGNIRLHNADKVIGDKLTWNISGFDCYDRSVVSGIVSPLERVPESQATQSPENKVSTDKSLNDKAIPTTNLPSEKTENQPLDASVALWTTVGASVATMIATIVAYITYRDSKKKK